MKRSKYYVGGIVVLALLWGQAELRGLQLTGEISGVYRGAVSVQAVDAMTHASLLVGVDGPVMGMGQRWPRQFTMSTTGDTSKMRIDWIGVEPVRIGVSAEGYERSDLQIDRSSKETIVVPLRKQGHIG